MRTCKQMTVTKFSTSANYLKPRLCLRVGTKGFNHTSLYISKSYIGKIKL